MSARGLKLPFNNIGRKKKERGNLIRRSVDLVLIDAIDKISRTIETMMMMSYKSKLRGRRKWMKTQRYSLVIGWATDERVGKKERRVLITPLLGSGLFFLEILGWVLMDLSQSRMQILDESLSGTDSTFWFMTAGTGRMLTEKKKNRHLHPENDITVTWLFCGWKIRIGGKKFNFFLTLVLSFLKKK